MTNNEFLLSNKYWAFIEHTDAKLEILEGTTGAGKTTVGVYKFMLNVAESTSNQHVLAGLDTGTIEKNIINKDMGLLELFGQLIEYNGRGTADEKLPHLLFHTNNGTKKIYVLGYDDKRRWKKALGGQYGCTYIDEGNIADIDFVREVVMRSDYVMITLNPDDPSLSIYSEYINKARPLQEWEKEVPEDILAELKEEPKQDWVYWFFNMDDNDALTEEKKATIIGNVPIGTKLYKNKIEGVRCRATGLIFGNFDYARNVRSETWVLDMLEKGKRYEEGRSDPKDRGFKFKVFSCGVDTAYSSNTEDTISMIFQGVTDTGLLITLDELVFNNKERSVPLAPTDIVDALLEFLNRNKDKWGFSRFVFVDSADQATIQELNKYKRRSGTVYKFENAYKKMKIIDRIILQRGWIQEGYYLVLPHCNNHMSELNKYSYKEDGTPEDKNDHTINAGQYSWLPYIKHIGRR